MTTTIIALQLNVMHCLTEKCPYNIPFWRLDLFPSLGGDIILFGTLYKLNIHQKAQNQIQSDDGV